METNLDGKTADGMQRRRGFRFGPPPGCRGRRRIPSLVRSGTRWAVRSMRHHLKVLRMIRRPGDWLEVIWAFRNLGQTFHRRGNGSSPRA